MVVTEYFIPNFKHENTVYLKLSTQIYCIPQNPGRPRLFVCGLAGLQVCANAVSDCVAVSRGPVEILAKLNDDETPNY